MRSIFGWSYPPGCNGPPDDPDGPCEVCGESLDNCICPECSFCFDIGNPACYINHGMRRTELQKFYKLISDRMLEDEFQASLDQAQAQYDEWAKDMIEGFG